MKCALSPVVRRVVFWSLLLMAGGWANVASALERSDQTLISPITGAPFPMAIVPEDRAGGDKLADMGADDDGCRHSSGECEYDFYVACDPTSFFSALTMEYDISSQPPSGRFAQPLSKEFRSWLDKQFNGELQIDINIAFQTAIKVNQQRSLPPPDRSTFQLAQTDIPIERRYHYAVACYAQRGARASTLAKVSLMGAWAIRSRVNLLLASPELIGGYQEVNDKELRHVKDGETFKLNKWLGVYKDIFDNARLTNEGYLVAGITYFGFAIRDGDYGTCLRILKHLDDRLKDAKKGENLRGLVRERRRMLTEHQNFLKQAAEEFMAAIANEEVTRQHLPETMLVVAECLRRLGNVDNLHPSSDDSEGPKPKPGDEFLSRSYDWYLALAKMTETDPKGRQEIRDQGGAPGPDAPYQMQLGWIADRHLAAMQAAGVIHPDEPNGMDKPLLSAILFEHFGTSEYKNPMWKPTTGGTQQDCEMILDRVGKATLEFEFHISLWPKTLGELWDRDVVRDRNFVNRFNCPVTGAPLLYTEPVQDIKNMPPLTVLVCTSQSIPTKQGPRYGAFLANSKVLWTSKELKPGEIFGQGP